MTAAGGICRCWRAWDASARWLGCTKAFSCLMSRVGCVRAVGGPLGRGYLRACTPGLGGWVIIWSKKRRSRATKRSKRLLRRQRRMALFIAKGGARGIRSHFWGPKWPCFALRSARCAPEHTELRNVRPGRPFDRVAVYPPEGTRIYVRYKSWANDIVPALLRGAAGEEKRNKGKWRVDRPQVHVPCDHTQWRAAGLSGGPL